MCKSEDTESVYCHFLNTFRLQSLLAYAEFPLTRASFQSTRTYGKVTLHCLQMRSTYNFSIKNEFHTFFFRSVSFILATGATSFFLFAICYILTDGLDWWNGAPFFYPGNKHVHWFGDTITLVYNQFLSQRLGSLGVTVQILSLAPNPRHQLPSTFGKIGIF